MSERSTTLAKSAVSMTRSTAVLEGGAAASPMSRSEPLGSTMRSAAPCGSIAAPKRLKSSVHSCELSGSLAAQEMGSHGVTLLTAHSFSAMCTAERMPSSWKP